MIYRRLLVVLLVVSWFVPMEGLACSCLPTPPVLEAAIQADAVFSGRVVALRIVPSDLLPFADSEDLEVTIQVEKAWKGVHTTEVVLRTPWTCCACGYGFLVGQSYLVYGIDGKNGLVTSACTRTTLIKDAADELSIVNDHFELLKLADSPSPATRD